MGSKNQQDKEKLFSENINNLLAGNKPGPDASMGEDARESLNFASKLITSTPQPSPAFEARLKSKLLQKLAEDEEKNRGWSFEFLRQPVWQVAISTLALVVIAGAAVLIGELNHRETLVTSVQTTTTTSMTSATTTTTAAMVSATTATTTSMAPSGTQNALTVKAQTSKSTYSPGELVEIQVSLKNITASPVTLEKYPPILSIIQTESRQPVYTHIPSYTDRTLMPGENNMFSIFWTQYNMNGTPVTGDFYIELEDMDYLGKALKLTLASPVIFSIRPGIGSISPAYETININQSQTVNGITVILQKVELSANGARLTAFITAPPDYNGNPGSRDYAAFATYYLDNGWVNYAGLSSVEYRPVDMKHTWFLSEPIPPDTKELLFVVTSIGKWEGPWQFTIPLGQ